MFKNFGTSLVLVLALGCAGPVLAQGQTMRMAPSYAQRNSQVHSTIPWGFLLVVVGVIAVLWAVMRRRSATAVGFVFVVRAIEIPASSHVVAGLRMAGGGADDGQSRY